MTYVYLDWNVFDRIERLENFGEDSDTYSKLEALITGGRIICPYSNAHINDLLRGYSKNPIYISGH